jgi:hypothetical protein
VPARRSVDVTSQPVRRSAVDHYETAKAVSRFRSPTHSKKNGDGVVQANPVSFFFLTRLNRCDSRARHGRFRSLLPLHPCNQLFQRATVLQVAVELLIRRCLHRRIVEHDRHMRLD